MNSYEEAFIDSMFEAAIWADLRDDEGEPMDEKCIDDFDPASREYLEREAREFYRANSEHIHCEGAPLASDFEGPIGQREAARAGHDFWLNRNGHGAGFWDGDWPEPAASALDKAARAAGNVDIYVGDDGLIYV